MKTLNFVFCGALLISSITSYSQDIQEKLIGTWLESHEKVENGEKLIEKNTWKFDNDSLYAISENVKASGVDKMTMTFSYKINGQNIQLKFMEGMEGKFYIKELTESKLTGSFKMGQRPDQSMNFMKENK